MFRDLPPSAPGAEGASAVAHAERAHRPESAEGVGKAAAPLVDVAACVSYVLALGMSLAQ